MMLTAFTGGRVLTMDPGLTGATVVLADGDRIAAVGGRELVAAHPDAEVIDLGGSVLIPGFIDAHNHLSVAALHPRWHDVAGVRD
ncbi:MAG TPA: amidohydrolase, partial [Acidimicrobiia bacterium]|nr:amidohydrolase [Acidimicrobiia bacterium]